MKQLRLWRRWVTVGSFFRTIKMLAWITITYILRVRNRGGLTPIGVEFSERSDNMLKLVKVPESDTDRILYRYYPEYYEGYGIIEIYGDEVKVTELADYDKELGVPYYANRARAAVLRMLETGKLEDSKFFAWG